MPACEASRQFRDILDAVRNWCHKGIGLIVLFVLTGLPVSGLVCAIDCAAEGRSTTVASGHHGSPTPCHEMSNASTTIEGTSDHDCEHADRAAAAFLTAVRVDTTVLSIKQSIVATPHAALAPFAGRVQPRSGAPPGTAGPARTPLVLRI